MVLILTPKLQECIHQNDEYIRQIIDLVIYFNDPNTDFSIDGYAKLREFGHILMNQPSLRNSTIPGGFIEYCLQNRNKIFDFRQSEENFYPTFRDSYFLQAFTAWTLITIIHLESLKWTHEDFENLTRKTQISLNLIHSRLYASRLPIDKLIINQLDDLERSIKRLNKNRLSWVGYFVSYVYSIPSDKYLDLAYHLIQTLKDFMT